MIKSHIRFIQKAFMIPTEMVSAIFLALSKSLTTCTSLVSIFSGFLLAIVLRLRMKDTIFPIIIILIHALVQ